MWPDRVPNPGPLAPELDALPTALRGSAKVSSKQIITCTLFLDIVLYRGDTIIQAYFTTQS